MESWVSLRRGAGIPSETLLLDPDADPHASVIDLGPRVVDVERLHAGGSRGGDAFRAHDRDEVAHAHGSLGPRGRRASPRPGPPGPQDRVPPESRRLGRGDEAPVTA